MNNERIIKRYTLAEEIFNSISHGIGALLSIVALVILVSFASISGDVWKIVSFSIYGFTLFFLYMSSTLYHSIFHEKAKRILRILDHSSIYLLIAGSYTPITLISLRGTWGWTLFTLIWTLAITGIVLKIISLEKLKKVSVFLYIFMGWLIIIAIKPMLSTVPKGLFLWLLLGGLIYTLGVIFYSNKKIPFNHAIWHLFVLGGSVAHFLGILFYLT
ncbi:hemolysin III [Desulfonispora thiosulfatigenes DSM 11270]|uniref:Hemolysin III n=1 Tax=Desulfonispora thiosulfatigenes DSM 11270 TaxID=656914 RepID=A0A1W1VRV3_DESTI|nr:hemolysin III family protein [Desulfonispora thiosulfatigenes]SMB96078.1 hemolysin III [Desulfonispora thiosulfatigenes DSM 11270]